MFAVKTILSKMKIVNALSGKSGAALANNCHFGSKDINKKYMCRQSPDTCFDSTRFCSLVKLSIFTSLIIHGITHSFSRSTWRCRRLPVHYSTYLPLDWLNVFLGLSSWLGEYTWTKFKHCLCFNYKGLRWAYTLHLLFPQGYISAGWFRYFTCLAGSPCCKHATLFKILIPELDGNKILSKRFSSVIIYQ